MLQLAIVKRHLKREHLHRLQRCKCPDATTNPFDESGEDMANRSKKEAKNKSNPKPPKPYADYPLTPHPQGYWVKTINGKLHYFGRWGRVVKGQMVRLPDDGWQAALDRYTEQRDDLYAGRKPKTEKRRLKRDGFVQ